jgi:hypothetical protein
MYNAFVNKAVGGAVEGYVCADYRGRKGGCARIYRIRIVGASNR